MLVFFENPVCNAPSRRGGQVVPDMLSRLGGGALPVKLWKIQKRAYCGRPRKPNAVTGDSCNKVWVSYSNGVLMRAAFQRGLVEITATTRGFQRT